METNERFGIVFLLQHMVQAGLAPPYGQYGQGGTDAAVLAQAAAAAAAAAAASSSTAVPTSSSGSTGAVAVKTENGKEACDQQNAAASTAASTTPCSSGTSTATSTVASLGSQAAAVAAALDSLNAAAAHQGALDQSSLAVSALFASCSDHFEFPALCSHFVLFQT